MNLSQDFWEKVIIIVMTAVMTGFLVPYLLKKIDERKLREQKEADERRFREQKIFEADLARQSKIIEAQSKLLDDLTHLLWRWRYVCNKVTYYARMHNQRKFDLAKEEFDKNIWDILQHIWSEISRSKRLVPHSAYENLKELYEYILSFDEEVSRLVEIEKLDEGSSYRDLNDKIRFEVAKKISNTLTALAGELQLKGSS